MARATQGGAYERRGAIFLRVTIAAGERRSERLPWVTLADWQAHDPTAARCPCVACERARAVQALVLRYRAGGADLEMVEGLVRSAAPADAAKMAAIARGVEGFCEGKIPKAAPAVPASTVLTYEAFAMRWVRGELAALYPDEVDRKRSAYEDLCTLRRYVFPVVGPKAIGAVTLDDYQQVLREADARCTKKKCAPATRRQIGQVMRRVLELAQYPARHIATNPIPAAALPKKRPGMVGQFIYPDEDTITMRDTRADLGVRVWIGIAHRLGSRRAELVGGNVGEVDGATEDEDTFGDVPALVWGRVDLRRGYILPDRNKTQDASLTPLDADLARALTAWKRLTPQQGADDPIFVTTAGQPITPDVATDAYRDTIRAALIAADADRLELWTPARGQMGLRLHDARASFVTVALLNGRGEDWVRRRSKHKSSAIERYRRDVGTFRELSLGDWVPLDVAIPELAAVLAADAPPAAIETAAEAAADIPSTALPASVAGLQNRKVSEGSETSRGEWIRTTDPQTPRVAIDATATDVRDVASGVEGAYGGPEALPPPGAAASVDPDAALLVAIKAALDAGDFARVKALVTVLEARPKPAAVVDLASRRTR